MEREFIVLCGEYYNPLGIIRSLGEAGIKPITIVKKNEFQLTSKSKYIKKLHFVNSIEEGFNLLLETYANEKCPPYVYTADDKTMTHIDQHYDEIRGRAFCFNAGKPGRITFYMNKDNINRIAIKHGLNVLNATVVNKGEIPSGLEYPIITKPIASTMGAWKGDMYICNSEKDLKEAYGKILSEKLLLQKYIHKKNEYCLEGLSVAHGQSVAISIASSYNYILDNGYSPYMTVRNFDKPALGEKLKEILKEIGYEGIFEIEFLVDENDQLWFCEINFRNSTWSYASTCAGMNLPYKWAEYMRQGKIDSDFIKKVPSDFTAMVEVHDYANRVKTNKISKLQWFNELRKCKCRYFLGKNDLMPVLSMFMHKLEGKR